MADRKARKLEEQQRLHSWLRGPGKRLMLMDGA